MIFERKVGGGAAVNQLTISVGAVAIGAVLAVGSILGAAVRPVRPGVSGDNSRPNGLGERIRLRLRRGCGREAGLAGPRGLDRGVEREDVRLKRDLVDRLDDF